MSYNIDRIIGSGTNAWQYWVINPPNGNTLTLGATLNFDQDYGKIIINAGTIFNGNGYSFNFTNIKTTGIQLFDLQGGSTSNISIGTSVGTKGILLINTLNNNSSTIMNGNVSIIGNLSISEIMTSNIINGNTINGNILSSTISSGIITSNIINGNTINGNTINGNTINGNIVSNNVILNGNDLQRILNNKIDNSTKNIMFKF